MSARTKRLRMEHQTRTVAEVPNAFGALTRYVEGQNEAFKKDGMPAVRLFEETHRYVGRGHHQAKWNSSRKALTKRKTGKVYPHDSKREAARHLRQMGAAK